MHRPIPAAGAERLRALAVLLLAAAIAACGTKETLVAKPAVVPDGVDLSGQWLLGNTSGTTQPAARETLVYAFLETGKSLRITQTDSGLFISFDRSVVEEYQFGEDREVSVGEIRADRVSGWEGGAYVVETLDKDGARLVDTYRVSADGTRLVRTIALWAGTAKRLSLEQVYDRV